MPKFAVALLLVLLSGGSAFAQGSGIARGGARAKSEISDSEKALRLKALSTLGSVIDELPQVENLLDRLSIAEGAVKLLAKTDTKGCRKLLDSLFDGAREARAARLADKNAQVPNPDLIVERIVRLATLFDAKLAESYIDRYSAPDESGTTSDPNSNRKSAQNAALRLKMALDLIDKAPASSVSVAETSLGAGVFPETLAFLSNLRKRDVALANRFFANAVASVRGRGGLDVNELLLLYAYVFSPLRVPVVSSQGLGTYNIPAYNATAQEYPTEPVLARLYLAAAAQAVLDPNRLNPENLPSLARGIVGDYYFVSFIQPAAVNYAPSLVDSLSVRRTVLGGLLQAQQREASDAATERWNNMPPKVNLTGGGDSATADYLMARAEKTSDPTRKDLLYYQAASAAVRARDYDRAIEIVDKIAGPYSGEAKQFIAFDIALNAAKNKDIDKAEFFGRRDDNLTRRAFVLTVIAATELEGKPSNPKRAQGLLEEVTGLASRLDKQAEKAAVLFGVVTVYTRFDLTLALESLTLAIDAANRLEGFGRHARIQSGLDIGGYLFDYSMYGEEFTFMEGIRTLASSDFDGTMSHVRILKSRVPRLRATVVICGAVLAKS